MNCPQCKQPIEQDAKFCRQCGMEVALMPVRPCCAVCGAEMDEAHHFCGKCGASVQSAPEAVPVVEEEPGKVFCAQCGHEIAPEHHFCMGCGCVAPTAVKSSDVAPPEATIPEAPASSEDVPPPQEPPMEETPPVIVEPEVVVPPPVEASTQPAAPAKKGNPLALGIVFVAILAIFIFAIYMFGNQESEEDSFSAPAQAEVQPEESLDIEEDDRDVASGQVSPLAPTESNAPTEQILPDELLPYAQVIENYLDAYDGEWTLTSEVNEHVLSGENLSDVGYTFVDLNGDDVSEMVLGFSRTFSQCFEIYGMQNGALTKIMSAEGWSTYYITQTGFIKSIEIPTIDATNEFYYGINSDGTYGLAEGIIDDYSHGDSVFWYVGPASDYEPMQINTAQDYSVRTSYYTMNFNYTPLTVQYESNLSFAWNNPGIVGEFSPNGEWLDRTALFESYSTENDAAVNMDALLAADIFGSTFYMAYDEGWLDEWLSLYINGGSDAESQRYSRKMYNDILEEWTLYGITRAEADAAGWGYIWDEMMQ